MAQVTARFSARHCLLICALLVAACSTTTDGSSSTDTPADNSFGPTVTSAAATSRASVLSSSETSAAATSRVSNASSSAIIASEVPAPTFPVAASENSAAASSPLPAPEPAPSAAVADPLPFPVQADNSSQLITVAAAAAGSTDIILTGWERGPDGNWTPAIGPVSGVVGTDGIGAASETTSFTPVGTFPLTQAFGIDPNPGSGLPYQQVDLSDWWVSDVNSLQYNTFQSCTESDCPFDTAVSEQLATITPEYAYAVVIDYNTAPAIAGAGSAFFLHVSRGIPTQGCVAIDSPTLVQILKWLDPTANPVIGIGLT